MPELTPEEQITNLQNTIKQLESTSKLLIRRDLALRNAYDNLKSLDVEKTEFVSIAAHQLRTPVTSARWAVAYMMEQQHSLSEKQQTLLNRASTSIERIYKLVEELLELNRIDFGTIQLDKKSGSIERLCEDIISEHEHIKEQSHAQISRDFSREHRPVVFDPLKLKQVIDNLVDNAIKYSGEEAVITVQTVYSQNQVTINIKDHGIGIEPGNEGRIFNKFVRLENAEKIDPNGTGLGLYVSQKIIAAHDGTITYTRNQPHGSVFSVTLPC